MRRFIANSTDETVGIAKIISKKIKPGDTILLYGDLGAGKTTFTKSLIKELGVNGNVTSPTFTLVNEYTVNNLKINHFDMYRIDDESEVQEIGIDEMFADKNSINIVEWPQKVSSYLPQDCIQISINILGENEREFIVEGIDE